MPPSSVTHKLSPIEGLRGYLALMVVVGHVFIFGAYVHEPAYFHTDLGGLLDITDHAGLAVNCFMIVSGFVIFMLIDRKKEPYRVYILRRFLRIFPVFFLFFLLALHAAYLAGINLEMTQRFQSPEMIQAIANGYRLQWENFWYHFVLHLTMLHGLVPGNILPDSPGAFLGPGWSLSLEWQFYLIAPLWYALFVTKVVWQRMLMLGVCLFFIFKAHYFFAEIDQGAILPAQLAYFLAGIVSYFIFKALRDFPFRADFVLPTIVITGLAIYRWTDKPMGMIPLLVWSVMLGLFLEPRDSISSRLLAPILTNRVSLWLGKVSYGIYLSHALVLIVVQYFALRYITDVTQGQLLWTTLLGTLAITIPLAGLVYRMVEAPFIELGKKYTGESTRVTLDLKGDAPNREAREVA